MRIILIGQAAFAEKVLDGVRGNGHEVVAVYCPPDAPGGKPDPVQARATTLGIPVRQHASLKRPEVAQEFKELDGDLGVLAYVTQIVPQSVFEVPRLGSICFHPSLLPRYRGGSAIPWQLIKGETQSGVSVFWVDPGIDTGPIILQKHAPIDHANKLTAPVLLFYGDKDGFISLDEVERVKTRLAELKKNAEVVVYPGADHGFFCNERASYHAESAKDAWSRLLKFFEKHLKA